MKPIVVMPLFLFDVFLRYLISIDMPAARLCLAASHEKAMCSFTYPFVT